MIRRFTVLAVGAHLAVAALLVGVCIGVVAQRASEGVWTAAQPCPSATAWIIAGKGGGTWARR